MEKDAVYEVFQKGLTNVNGECYLAKAAEVRHIGENFSSQGNDLRIGSGIGTVS